MTKYMGNFSYTRKTLKMIKQIIAERKQYERDTRGMAHIY